MDQVKFSNTDVTLVWKKQELILLGESDWRVNHTVCASSGTV